MKLNWRRWRKPRGAVLELRRCECGGQMIPGFVPDGGLRVLRVKCSECGLEEEMVKDGAK